jgi:hypothetical protein
MVRIFEASRGLDTLLTKLSNDPYSSADFSQNVPPLLRASSNVSPAEERDLDDPAASPYIAAFKSACTYTEARQAVPLVTDPGSKLLTTPPPRIGVGVLRECHASK